MAVNEGPDGLLIVDKPAGMTSHDVVDHVRRKLQTKKVGHAGTLDPDATGVLVLGIGRATRLLSYAQSAPKSYRADATFGVTTSTQDASGDVIEERPVTFDRADLERVVAEFTGEIEQVPPMVSAVKVGGERLYKKARRGEEVERPARAINVYALSLESWIVADATAVFEVTCSAGTYVRTLVADMGERLGCGAHLSRLRRMASGGFTLDDAVDLQAVTVDDLRPTLDVVSEMKQVEVDESSARSVANGSKLDAIDGAADDEVVAIVHDARLLALYRRRGNVLVAEKVIA